MPEQKIEYKTINFDRIAAEKSLSAFTRLAAINIKNSKYVMIGEFFKGIPQADLDMLSKLADRAVTGFGTQEEVSQAINELLILTEMLANAEGMPSMNDEQSYSNLNFMMTIIACISLERKGIADVIYENISFGDDMRTKEIVKLRG